MTVCVLYMSRAFNLRTRSEDNQFFDAYIAGSFMVHIKDDLLWEEVREERQDGGRKLPEIPTWSWASTTGKVTFMKQFTVGKTSFSFRDSPQIPTCVLIGIISEVGQYYDTRETPLVLSRNLSNIFDLTTKYAKLNFRGRLLSVIVCDLVDIATSRRTGVLREEPTTMGFEDAEDDSEDDSRHELEFDASYHARQICCPGDPDTIAGWASFEHPDFRNDSPIEAQYAFLAFPITVVNKNTYSIIFIRRTQDHER